MGRTGEIKSILSTKQNQEKIGIITNNYSYIKIVMCLRVEIGISNILMEVKQHMKTIEAILKKEKKELERTIKEVERRLQNKSIGFLRIAQKKNHVEYYYKSGKSDDKEKYLRKSDIQLAHDIAQRDYDINILKNAKERIRIIDTFLKKYGNTDLEKVYQRMHPCRRKLILTDIIPDEEFVERWVAVKYEGKQFADNEQIIFTEKGERVRSKSEKIIADKLYMMGIPYRYEYPLLLKEGIKIYPDFTVLRMPQREEVYLEHFGMMDDSDYVNTVMYKLDTYEKNEIYLGHRLLITHETSRAPLNTKALEGIIKEMFVSE